MTPLEPTATTQKAAAGDPRRPAVEIPTLLLILATYAGWSHSPSPTDTGRCRAGPA